MDDLVYCPNCGCHVEPGYFCAQCGTPFPSDTMGVVLNDLTIGSLYCMIECNRNGFLITKGKNNGNHSASFI